MVQYKVQGWISECTFWYFSLFLHHLGGNITTTAYTLKLFNGEMDRVSLNLLPSALAISKALRELLQMRIFGILAIYSISGC
jgi:hypothetical protein